MQPTVKLLNAKFDSLADAFYSYCAHNGLEDQNQKKIDVDMIYHFCAVNMIPKVRFNSSKLFDVTGYFPTTRWLDEWLETNHFQHVDNGTFIRLDSCNRPIALLTLEPHNRENLEFSFIGEMTLGDLLIEKTKEHIRFDEAEEEKTSYVEIVAAEGLSRSMGGDLTTQEKRIDNAIIAQDVYYPYLDGGPKALIAEFMASEESVLIIMGVPGTGKSSAIVSALLELNLMAIYGKDTKVVNDPGFINKIFGVCDQHLAVLAGSNAVERQALFEESDVVTKYRPFYHIESPFVKPKNKTPRAPVIVIEDADILLSPRASGNKVMAELLNATSGLGSSFERKVIFTTNLTNREDIDEALMRPGRCFDVLDFRTLTPMEAIEARAAAGLPKFQETPTENVSLAVALRKPRKRVYFKDGVAELVNAAKH